ncbi:hypothetical protein QN277_012342 [Acacia crassicarpa]|uniref:non-specific serine/threonine protein kinase n=1 Tax=Acacia crassicarpa TaxID=499986 RepID=A0AAE1N0K7_9FABA|nr:hypothetical protein QN277_012342 [Acacia crassicarpa]
MEAFLLFLTSSSFFFFLSSFPLFHCLPDKEFWECQPSPCGKVGLIRYPFWSENIQPYYCGRPEFKLNCPQLEDKDDYPSIQIGSQTFYVTLIDLDNNKMTLMRTDFVYGDCSSQNLSTTNVSTVFQYDDELYVKNVTLFYNCSSDHYLTEGFIRFPCRPRTSYNSNSSNYAFCPEYVVNEPQLPDCKRRIQVPVSIEPDVQPQHYLQMLEHALDNGLFGVKYEVDESCNKCWHSDGRCGWWNDTSPFICYCRDGHYPRICPPKGISIKNKAIVASVTTVVVVLIMLVLFYFYKRRKRTGYAKSNIQSRTASSTLSSKMVDPEINASKYFGVPLFTYSELEEATNNFDSERELGDGGFGTVYKGKLRDGRYVAVKRLYENNYKRVEQFINEVQILTRLRHVNLVSLYGCTSRHSRELLLVYEYIPNGTLADHLHGVRAKPGTLPWNIRMNIAIETATALAYLHASDIIHRDVKTNNILLDDHFVVKVADFGLSRLFPDHVTHVSTAPQGTPGYVDPEYHECYQLTNKSDVYSFGVVLIELISSLPAVDITRHRHEINLSTMAINKIQKRALHELVDPTLGFESDQKVRRMINAVVELAFQCLQNLKDMRPSMEEVAETLRNIHSDGKHMSKPEVLDISGDDDIGLLKNVLPPTSPDSNLASKSTTSNSSNSVVTTRY